MIYAPSDYLARFEANTGWGMVHPARHEDWRVRSLFWKRRNRRFEAIVTDCAKPSAEYDKAWDDMHDAAREYENVITSQMLHRAAANSNARVAA